MRLLFSRAHSLSSLLIRFVTWGRWSHVSIIEDGANVIDSTFLHGGVRRRPLLDVVAASSHFEVVDLALPDEAAAIAWARSQIGKPYDWSAVLGILFRVGSWSDPSRWFCSEFAESAVLAGGLKRFREDASRITPEHSWMVV
jgi:uncharacterized protein YycO